MPLNLQHQTPTQFAARLWERYRGSSKEECARIASWILDRIAAGDITDAQMRAIGGLTAAQWTTLKAKMTTLQSNWAAIQAAKGE